MWDRQREKIFKSDRNLRNSSEKIYRKNITGSMKSTRRIIITLGENVLTCSVQMHNGTSHDDAKPSQRLEVFLMSLPVSQ